MSALIERCIEAQYDATHRRLAGTPEYERLKQAAKDEEQKHPHSFIDRNRLAFHVELNMPPL